MTQKEAEEIFARHGVATPTQGRSFVVKAAEVIAKLERQVSRVVKAKASEVPKGSLVVLKADRLDAEDVHQFNESLRAAGSQHRGTIGIAGGCAEIDVLDVGAQQDLMVRILETMDAEVQAKTLEKLAEVLMPAPVGDDILESIEQVASPEEMKARRQSLRAWADTVTEDEEEE